MNYRPTPKSDPNFKQGIYWHHRQKKEVETIENLVDINKLNAVKFGFGVSRGGMHTWLFSQGYIYEVHWDKIGKDLYEKTRVEDFPWLDSVIVFPPDQLNLMEKSKLTRCEPKK